MDATGAFTGPEADLAFDRVTQAGARVWRSQVSWLAVASRRPANPRDPADPAYRWAALDERIRRATSHGVEPLLYIQHLPSWAMADGPNWHRPSPAALADFVAALATRYSGTYEGLPRVRYWQAWNEPNLEFYLRQEGLTGADHFRDMVNAFGAAVKGVDPSNLVVAGGTGPFSGNSTTSFGTQPLNFMAQMLCLSMDRNPKRVCDERVSFDVWAHNPYTSGRPLHKAANKGDVSIGDLPAMSRLLRIAHRKGQITGKRPQFWATEFSWDTAPPDPGGVPEDEHARWVAEGLYRMWASGVSLVVWFGLRDDVKGDHRTWGQSFQSGLWYRGGDSLMADRPKPALQAFRFPFVALPSNGAVKLWGRTPGAAAGTVTIEQRRAGRWQRMTTLRADVHGIFRATLSTRSRSRLRARVGAEASVAFAPRVTRERRVNPFGGDEPEPVTPKP